MIWATVCSRFWFCWLYRTSPSLAAKNRLNLTNHISEGIKTHQVTHVAPGSSLPSLSLILHIQIVVVLKSLLPLGLLSAWPREASPSHPDDAPASRTAAQGAAAPEWSVWIPSLAHLSLNRTWGSLQKGQCYSLADPGTSHPAHSCTWAWAHTYSPAHTA